MVRVLHFINSVPHKTAGMIFAKNVIISLVLSTFCTDAVISERTSEAVMQESFPLRQLVKRIIIMISSNGLFRIFVEGNERIDTLVVSGGTVGGQDRQGLTEAYPVLHQSRIFYQFGNGSVGNRYNPK